MQNTGGRSGMEKRRKEVEEVEREVEVDSSGVVMPNAFGLVAGTSIIMGTVIGSGIFVSPKGVLANTGSVALSIIVWVLSGAIALMGSLCFAELGTLVKQSGSHYAYLRAAYGNIPAFLSAWTSVTALTPSGLAIAALTFAQYTSALLPMCGAPRIPVKLIAAVLLVTLALMNCYSTRLAARVQIVFTMAKLAALAIIIVGGIVRIAQGHTEVLQTGFEDSVENPATISRAFYSALWAYDGWSSLNYVVEELEEPKKNLPLACVLSCVIVTVVYTLTNISYYTVVTTSQLLASSAVAVTWGDVVLGAAALLMPVSVMVSTIGSVSATFLASVRLFYAAGRHGNLPDVMSYVHCHYYTPVPCLAVTLIMSLVMIVPGDIGSLIDFFSFTAWMFNGLSFLALILLRYTSPWSQLPRSLKVPLAIPIVMVVLSVYLVVAPIVDSPRVEFLYAVLFIVGGLVFYIPFIVYKVSVKFYDQVCIIIQLLLHVVPSKRED